MKKRYHRDAVIIIAQAMVKAERRLEMKRYLRQLRLLLTA